MLALVWYLENPQQSKVTAFFRYFFIVNYTTCKYVQLLLLSHTDVCPCIN